ncbi:RNA polymerase sigma factor [Leucobacter weissii]|uniref:RNA polymerase sigma factor n=1 Tax=Leucobacter weissii TaxID=1983706 RepID=A0A939S6L2_9MICO|nr:DUF6596 domain-containing protein [Leucobacter weissii]MBO1902499.1 RNA polymerase sigma factor [Leucobacter weissii]
MTAWRAAPHAPASDAALAAAVREETARIVAALNRSFGSLDVAEEATAGAVEEALVEWRRRGVPPRPGAWLMTAARRNALDLVRRSRRYREVLRRAAPAVPTLPRSAEPDERIPLLFGCCHPSLSPEAQLALTLRAVLGVSTAQIARATLEPSATVGQRISRAKRKIGAAGVPIRIPAGPARTARLDPVLATIAVMYDSAHLRAESSAEAHRDLADDALWLARALSVSLPDEPEVHGLRALLLLHRAREPARSVAGELVPLPLQDRARWDDALVRAGREALERAAEVRRPGRWQLHAAIAACHADAARQDDTDWAQIVVLYDLLLAVDSSPIVRLNRAVAVAETGGVGAALTEVEALAPRLDGYRLWHAVRAELLRRAGRSAEARTAVRSARELADNEAERRLLASRLGPE